MYTVKFKVSEISAIKRTIAKYMRCHCNFLVKIVATVAARSTDCSGVLLPCLTISLSTVNITHHIVMYTSYYHQSAVKLNSYAGAMHALYVTGDVSVGFCTGPETNSPWKNGLSCTHFHLYSCLTF